MTSLSYVTPEEHRCDTGLDLLSTGAPPGTRRTCPDCGVEWFVGAITPLGRKPPRDTSWLKTTPVNDGPGAAAVYGIFWAALILILALACVLGILDVAL